MTAAQAPSVADVRLRDLWGQEKPADLIHLDGGGAAVIVPGLGHVIVAMSPTGWRALFTQGPGLEFEREVRSDGDQLLVDVLVNHDGRGVQVCFRETTS